MQMSRLNQTEICPGQDSMTHSMSNVIQSFREKITHGPEYLYALAVISYGLRSSVSKYNSIKYSDKYLQGLLEECITGTKSVNNTEWIFSTCLT